MKERKYTAILLILPLFTLVLTLGHASQADALNVSTSDGNGGHRFGATTEGQMIGKSSIGDGNGGKRFGATTQDIVCGDRLCSEPARMVEAKIIEQEPVQLGGPYLKELGLIRGSANSDDLFKAIYNVYSGDYNVADVTLLVKSDKEQVTATIGGISLMASSPVTMYIRADDPASIHADILSWKHNN